MDPFSWFAELPVAHRLLTTYLAFTWFATLIWVMLGGTGRDGEGGKRSWIDAILVAIAPLIPLIAIGVNIYDAVQASRARRHTPSPPDAPSTPTATSG